MCKFIIMIHHMNRMKDKNCMTISVDTEKALDTQQIIYILVEGTYLT